jgi:hypothetical protein
MSTRESPLPYSERRKTMKLFDTDPEIPTDDSRFLEGPCKGKRLGDLSQSEVDTQEAWLRQRAQALYDHATALEDDHKRRRLERAGITQTINGGKTAPGAKP